MAIVDRSGVVVWGDSSDKPSWRWQPEKSPALSVAWMDDGQHLLVGDAEGDLQLLGVGLGVQRTWSTGLNRASFLDVGVGLHAGQLLVAGGKQLELWDLSSERRIAQSSFGSSIIGLARDPRSAIVAVATGERLFRLRSLDEPGVEAVVHWERVVVNDVAISPDGSRLAALAEAGLVGIWNRDELLEGSMDPY